MSYTYMSQQGGAMAQTQPASSASGYAYAHPQQQMSQPSMPNTLQRASTSAAMSQPQRPQRTQSQYAYPQAQQQDQMHHFQQQFQGNPFAAGLGLDAGNNGSAFHDMDSFEAAQGNIPSGFMSAQEQNEANLDALFANYQPHMTGNGVLNGMPDTSQLGLAPVMGSGGSNPQLDPATAAAAAAAYGSLGRAMVASNQPQDSTDFPYGLYSGDGSHAFEAASASDRRSSASAHQRAKGRTSNHSGSAQPAGGGPGGYEGDGSNSASTQTPAPSSGGEDQEALKSSVQFNNVDGLAPHRGMPEHLRASSSASFSSAGGFGKPQGANQRQGSSYYQTGSRVQRAHSGSNENGDFASPSKSADGTKRLSGPAITVGGTSNNRRPSLYQPNPPRHSVTGQTLAIGHAASHPPGTGSHVLRGIDNHIGGSNAASDFTRRKGWHTRIVDELLDFVHVLDKDGLILHAASSVGAITGWRPDELIGKNVQDFIHPDDASDFFTDFSQCYRDSAEMTLYYRFRKKPQTAADKQRVRDLKAATEVASSTSEEDSSNQDSTSKNFPKFTDIADVNGINGAEAEGYELVDDSVDRYVVMEVSGHPYFWTEGADNEAVARETADFASSLVESKSDVKTGSGSVKKEDEDGDKKSGEATADDDSRRKVKCFFCSGRVYPTRNIGMLDSFLELKLENERMRNLLADMSLNDNSTDKTGGSSDGRRSLEEVGYHPDYTIIEGAHPQASHRASNVSLGSNEGDEKYHMSADAAARKQSAHSAANLPSAPTSPHTTSFDRSGASGPSGDADEPRDDSASPVGDDEDEAARRKKKKAKQEEGDYVCTDCGRVDSPEWRKGPLGPKTLCNACGLRWAKKVKRSGGDPNAMTGKGITPGGSNMVQTPFGEMDASNFGPQAQRHSMSADPHGHPSMQISGAPGYAGYPGGPDGMQHHLDHHPHPGMPQQHGSHQGQSLFGAMQNLYGDGMSGGVPNHVPSQHAMNGMGDPMQGQQFMGHGPNTSSVMTKPTHPGLYAQHSGHHINGVGGQANNMMGQMYGGGGP